ncbi:hypothetical protein MCOR25_008235 [Pyricularia grisea]|nr:hypothetical protein MCOR25_008235 [Pyricularia grisea]
MILIDGFVCYVTTGVVSFGSNTQHPERFEQPYSIIERFQITVFCVQEKIISGLYIYEIIKILQTQNVDYLWETRQPVDLSRANNNLCRKNKNRLGYCAWRRMLTHLIYISVVIVLIDVPLLSLQYLDLYALQTSYKAFAYGIKLKLELSILNRLVVVTTRHGLIADASRQTL